MKALVTGGGGFLGRAIVEMLRVRGDTVTVVARRKYPEIEALGVKLVRTDLSDPTQDALAAALSEVDVVFHVAAKTGVWGRYSQFVASNVHATANILETSRRMGIKRFVFTSSPSVTFDGQDAEGVAESDIGYPDKFEASYPETKAIAERMVLEANNTEFATCALRPHLVWGPRDPHIFPRIIARARQGRLRRIGSGQNQVALTYIDHAADAHLRAADALYPNSVVAGKAYFITDGSPVNLWAFIDRLLLAMNLKPIQREVSQASAHRIGMILEHIWRTLRLPGEPPMTRFLARELATSHWYDISAAHRDFGYQPFRNLDVAFDETVRALRGDSD